MSCPPVAAMHEGRVFAAFLHKQALTQHVSGPALASALAVTFAALLVDQDEDPERLFEAFAFGTADDEARIAVFVEMVRVAMGEMRASRAGRAADA